MFNIKFVIASTGPATAIVRAIATIDDTHWNFQFGSFPVSPGDGKMLRMVLFLFDGEWLCVWITYTNGDRRARSSYSPFLDTFAVVFVYFNQSVALWIFFCVQPFSLLLMSYELRIQASSRWVSFVRDTRFGFIVCRIYAVDIRFSWYLSIHLWRSWCQNELDLLVYHRRSSPVDVTICHIRSVIVYYCVLLFMHNSIIIISIIIICVYPPLLPNSCIIYIYLLDLMDLIYYLFIIWYRAMIIFSLRYMRYLTYIVKACGVVVTNCPLWAIWKSNYTLLFSIHF